MAEPIGGSLDERLTWLRRMAIEREDEYSVSPLQGTTEVGNGTLAMILEHIDALRTFLAALEEEE